MNDSEYIAIGRAFAATSAQYRSAGREDPEADARNFLLRRLETGTIRAVAARYVERHSSDDGWLSAPLSDNGHLPGRFWSYFSYSCRCEIDWLSGDFSVAFSDSSHRAEGVRVRKADLPDLAIASPAAETRKSKMGRKPATWWAHFAEELAVFVHSEGVPDGEGGDGQSAIFDAICDALTRRGFEDEELPKDSAAKDVIGKVLKRLRSER